MFMPHGPSGQTILQTLRGQKKSISAPARSRTMGTGLMKSPTPGYYGNVPSLSPPVDWIMPLAVPNEDVYTQLNSARLYYSEVYLVYSIAGIFVP